MTGDPLPEWDLGNLASVRPTSILPAPASTVRDVRAKRLVVGLPGLGWRYDLRGDSTVVQGSRTYVPVLPEQEWYRAEAEQTEVFAPLVAIERVWVEVPFTTPVDAPIGLDVVSRLVSLDAPPRRDPIPAREAAAITGRRVVQMPPPEDKAGSARRDLRAVTEPYSSDDGDICVRVARELDWYRWAWSGQVPKTLEVPVHLLWVE